MFCILPTCHIFVTCFLFEVCECTDAFLSAAFRNYAHMRALEVRIWDTILKSTAGKQKKNTETLTNCTKISTCYKVDNYHKQDKLATNWTPNFKHVPTQEFTLSQIQIFQI